MKPTCIEPRHRLLLPLVYDDTLSYYETQCKIMASINNIIDAQTRTSKSLKLFETKRHITDGRKLSATGNFTGTIFNRPGNEILCQIDSGRDSLRFLAEQFSDGQTGQVIDGGFFTDDGISKNYSGGYF